jgi:hypothetical protein
VTPGPRSFRSLRGLPAEVWIDEQGLIRRMSYQSESGTEGAGEWWQTTELWDFGLDVQIRIPTEDELNRPDLHDRHHATRAEPPHGETNGREER